MANGYMQVGLSIDGKTATRYVHGLVAEAFLGLRPTGYDVNHIDGDKANNAVLNLEYCTRSENHRHAFRIGIRRHTFNPPRDVVSGKFLSCAK